MDAIGVFSPEQARLLWQDYQTRKQLPAQVTKHYPQRRALDEPSPHRVFVRNDSGEQIPAYACMQVTGTAEVGSVTVVTVTKPTTTDGTYLFNCQYLIAIGANGWAFRFGVVIMLGIAPSEAGALYGPIVGDWKIEEGGSLVEVYGPHNADAYFGLIGRFAGGTGGGSQRIWFVIREVECDIYTGAKILFVEVKEYTGGNCTSLVPGEDPYTGLVTVEDFCSTLSFFTAEQLLDGTGSATYFWPRGDGYCIPRWLVDDICVVPECA